MTELVLQTPEVFKLLDQPSRTGLCYADHLRDAEFRLRLNATWVLAL